MRVLMGVSFVLASVGALDAARGEHWDQFAMLIVLAALAVAASVIVGRAAAAVTLRPDLLAWARRQAALTDDEPALVINRALAAYRAQMMPETE